MKTWRFDYPGDNSERLTCTKTEAEIISEYFPWWSEQMTKVGKQDQISEQACIEDWVVVHWAYEVK